MSGIKHGVPSLTSLETFGTAWLNSSHQSFMAWLTQLAVSSRTLKMFGQMYGVALVASSSGIWDGIKKAAQSGINFVIDVIRTGLGAVNGVLGFFGVKKVVCHHTYTLPKAAKLVKMVRNWLWSTMTVVITTRN
jgi:hypothetical protein